MRAIVVGAGEVGYHVAEQLSKEQHDVVVVDIKQDRLEYVQSHIDVQVLQGNGASPAVLRQARLESSQMLIAVSSEDEVNLVCCAAARDSKDTVRIARVSNPDFYRDETRLHPELFGVDVMINPERELALETLRIIQATAATDIAVFAGGTVQIVGLEIQEGAPVAGRTLSQMGAEEGIDAMLTVAVIRDGKSQVPTGSTTLEAGDQIYVVVRPQGINRALELCGHKRARLNRVMITGGSLEAFYLAELLDQHDVQCTLLIKDRPQAQKFAEKLSKALILNGDATDVELLELEGVGGVDAFVALTEDDETNILSSLVAKDIGATRVVTLVNKIDYLPLTRRIGLGAGVSPRLSAANAILRYIRKGNVTRVAALKDTDGEAIGFRVAPHSNVAGKALKDLDFPAGAIAAAIVRGATVLVPRGQDELRVGDHVVVFALPDAVDKVTKLFPT